MCTTHCNCTVYYFINESCDNVLAHKFLPVWVGSPNCPGFCGSIVFSGVGDREHKQILCWFTKHGLQNSDLALKPVFGVIMQPKSGKAGYVF